MLVINAILSALINLVLLAGIPFLGYFLFHKIRHKRKLAEIVKRAGLQVGNVRYLGLAAALSLVVIAAVLIFPLPLEPLTRPGSAQRQFAGLGFSGTTVLLALIYGVVKTGFSEEFLFRGLIAGSLGRRLPLRWANLIQAAIFLLPHLPLLFIMPEMWMVVALSFFAGLLTGWMRMQSDSFYGPWLLHATANVAVTLSVAIRSAG